MSKNPSISNADLFKFCRHHCPTDLIAKHKTCFQNTFFLHIVHILPSCGYQVGMYSMPPSQKEDD